jgi:hypothetical protein
MKHRLLLMLYLLSLSVCHQAVAQPVEYLNSNDGVTAIFPGKKPFEWARTSGDFNDDGIDDLALLLVLPDDSPDETRLVVFAGVPGGRYKLMSASSTYCKAQKFFNMEAKGTNLYVTAIQYADPNDIVSETLQFRFNRQVGDMELIGREDAWKSFIHESYDKTSINYKTGKVVTAKRYHGRKRTTEQSSISVAPLVRLNGFNCANSI